MLLQVKFLKKSLYESHKIILTMAISANKINSA